MEINNKISELKKEKQKIQAEVKQNLAKYIGAAFGLIAGLAWNDAIKALIDYLFPLQTNGILAKFIYALIITLIVVIITVYFIKIIKKKSE